MGLDGMEWDLVYQYMKRRCSIRNERSKQKMSVFE